MASSQLLGDSLCSLTTFPSLDKVLLPFKTSAFSSENFHSKQEKVSRALYELISLTPSPCFLLAAVLDYIEKAQSFLDGYTFAHFELWLNQFSHLSPEENYLVRAKIIGKFVPRNAYQGLFPIGMGKTYPGSHFVTAHGSPDLDTTIASFWGWIDAFGARLAEGLHIWNVPGGAPESQVETDLLFPQLLGRNVFTALLKTRSALSLSAMDLMTQRGFIKEGADASILHLDHDENQKAIVLVGERGEYVGDWKSVDVERVRQVVSLFNQCLRNFSHYVARELLSLFALPEITRQEVDLFTQKILAYRFMEAASTKEFTSSQIKMLSNYLVHVLQLTQGLHSSFLEFTHAIHKLKISDFHSFLSHLSQLETSLLFDASGAFIAGRSDLLSYLNRVGESLEEAMEKVRKFVERLDVAIQIKKEVLGHSPSAIGYRADVDEMKSKMTDQTYLSVVASDEKGGSVPLGVIHAHDLARPILGTVTLRDFCNKEETKIPSYLEVISVIDHHKSQLHTTSAPMVLISDAQSSNVLCAEMAFQINDRFGSAGMSREKIVQQIATLQQDLSSPANKRILARLLQRLALIEEETGSFFIDPQRERVEYLQFLYGILDDTDLLTKVSLRDLNCVVELLNRLKTIVSGQEVEVISLQDIPKDENFIRKASLRLLQHPELYSLYRKVYLAKEELVEKSIIAESRGEKTALFADTKEQNGCARVGQAKLFPSNYATFAKHALSLQQLWQANAEDVFAHRAEIDLHLQMMSTIAGAAEVFAGSENNYSHQDELWIWIPFTDPSIEHLKEFLNSFSNVPLIRKEQFSLQLYGEKGQEYARLFAESFLPVSTHVIQEKGNISFASLRYKAGLLNSRKAMVSPYLPRLVR